MTYRRGVLPIFLDFFFLSGQIFRYAPAAAENFIPPILHVAIVIYCNNFYYYSIIIIFIFFIIIIIIIIHALSLRTPTMKKK